MTSKDFRRMFQNPCKLTNESAQAIPIVPTTNKQLEEETPPKNQNEEIHPSTQSGSDRFFCRQKLSYIEKGTDNKITEQALRMGNMDPSSLPKESRAPATYFEDQEIVYVNEGKGNTEYSVSLDFGNMGPWHSTEDEAQK
ncbi:hypothetical protein NE237_016842 [Protea cynaroides]|uniref:Uncharacterized protein n=1 Tax=Protea cynaroides TaxID=273540 RepID=A0A9Q0HEX8_9MAGN|nr:hypothetical protein NE237_016842 [Protea cynaroides]